MKNVKISPDGKVADLKPAGKKFTLKEVQDAVIGFIELWETSNGKDYIVVNKNGINWNLRFNKIASEFFNQNTPYVNTVSLVGEVAVIEKELFDISLVDEQDKRVNFLKKEVKRA